MTKQLNIRRRLDTRTNLGIAKLRTGRREIKGSPRLDISANLQDPRALLQLNNGAMDDAIEGDIILQGDSSPLEKNREPWKRRIFRTWLTRSEKRAKKWNEGRALLAMLMQKDLPPGARWSMFHARRELTIRELDELHELDEQNRFDAFHLEQARMGLNRLVNTMTRLGFAYRETSEGRSRVVREVVYGYVEYGPGYYRYYVDARHLPRSVSILDLASDDLVTNMSAAVGHPVRANIRKIGNVVIGLYHTIEIAATMGIPNQCKFSDLLPHISTSAPALTFLTGYAEGKRLRWANLEEMPHFLGGGQTLGGKSNMMHVMICSFIARNTPDDVRLLFIDLKFNGIELGRYRDIPHMINAIKDVPGGIAKTPEEGITVLRWALAEAKRRGKMFAKEDLQDLRKWNRRHPNRKLPYLVLMVDELAQLRTDMTHGKESYHLLQEIMAISRAAGLHFVTFTQSSNRRVVDEFIKINMPGRMCFSVPDAPSSILFVNDGRAVGLMPAGRAVYRYGTDTYAVQTPLIEASDIREIVTNAKLGERTSLLSSRGVEPEELIEWAYLHNQSELGVRAAYAKFGGELKRIEKATVEEMLKDMTGKTYFVGDEAYQVLPGVGRKPRIVVKIDDMPPLADEILQDETQDTED